MPEQASDYTQRFLSIDDNPYTPHANWYKGNLHVHTTNSDGEYSPQATVDIYAQAGYDFLAISDHDKLTEVDSLDGRGMLLLPAVEFGAGRAELGQSYHLLAIGLAGPPSPIEATDTQQAIDQVRAQAELLFIAHPYWSSLSARDLLEVTGYDGIEVYNTTCERGIGRGHSEPHWDDLLARGRCPWGIAVDDAHFHYWDALGGWIMVAAPYLDRTSVLAAIKKGHFYASSGPEIHSVSIADNTIHVECSAAVSVSLVVARPGRGWTTDRLRQSPDDQPSITQADLPLSAAGDAPFRIEVRDHAGNRAWTNAFRLS